MLEANRRRTLLSSAAVCLLLAAPRIAAAAPTVGPLAMQLGPSDPLAPNADTAAPTEAPPAPPPPTALTGLKIEGSGVTLKLGALFQPSYELAGRIPDPGPAGWSSSKTEQTFFLRRMRLIAGLSIGSSFEFFFDTDAPNLGKNASTAAAGTSNPAMGVQDAFMTWKPMDEFKLDGGLMLIPFSHNSIQGATTLYGLDYFASSFAQNGGFSTFVGRDVGVQARGLVIGHLEYRLGIFNGKRAPMAMDPVSSRAEMRVAARVQYNLFDPETAFFYAGTYAGTKKVVSFGAAVDHQDKYTAFDVDAFVDWPVGADVVTAQIAFLHFNGDTWINARKQNDFVVEAGYRLGALKISPIIRFEDQMYATVPGPPTMGGMPTTIDSQSVLRVSAGIAWWLIGHNLNAKVFYTYVKPKADAFNQLNVQVQLFVF
jgi:hypothetical protein